MLELFWLLIITVLPKCCSCFHHKAALNKHCCSEAQDIQKPKHKEENDNRISKDMAHYLSCGICKGSEEEVQLKLKAKNADEDKIRQAINNPRYNMILKLIHRQGFINLIFVLLMF